MLILRVQSYVFFPIYAKNKFSFLEIFFVRPHQEVNNNQLFFVLFKSFFDEKCPVFECFFVTIRKSAQILKKQNALIMSEL